jgi:hypothetical protein
MARPRKDPASRKIKTTYTLDRRTRRILQVLKMTQLAPSESETVDYLADRYGPELIQEAVERGELDPADADIGID